MGGLCPRLYIACAEELIIEYKQNNFVNFIQKHKVNNAHFAALLLRRVCYTVNRTQDSKLSDELIRNITYRDTAIFLRRCNL